MNTVTQALAASAVMLSASCASLPTHVQLPEAPPSTATVEARRAFYLAQRAVALRSATRSQTRGPPFLMLESGARVEDAADLLATVGDDEVLAAHADRADDLYGAHRLWTGVGAVTGVVGATAMVVGPAVVAGATVTADGVDLPLLMTTIIGGGLVAMIGLGAGAYGVSVLLPEAHREETSAFMRYDAALKRRLALSAADIGPVARGLATANAAGDFHLNSANVSTP